MRVVQGSKVFPSEFQHGIVTIGNFDGLHLGHQMIMETVKQRARHLGSQSAVFTFEPHPRKVIRPASAPPLLTTLEQKLELLELAGVGVVVIEEFTDEFARYDAADFVTEVIHARMKPKELYVGFDFHFGRDREGSRNSLASLGPVLGFSVTVIPEVTIEGQTVNSTRIRRLLSEGEVEASERLLGRPYSVTGKVIKGDQRGRTIGFPTLNLDCDNEVLPLEGVYSTEVRFEDSSLGQEWMASVTNVGRRPTFKEEDPVLAEAHVFNFSSDVYGERVELRFRHHIRGEKKFSNPEELVKQIRSDAEAARERLHSP